MLRTASSLPLAGLLTLGSDPPVSRRSRQPATGPPGSYPDRTSTGRRRRPYEHEETPWHYVTVSPPVLLGARKTLSVLRRGHGCLPFLLAICRVCRHPGYA